MHIDPYVRYLLFLSDLMKLEFFRDSVAKSSNIKFYQNPPSGSRVVSCEQIDVTKLIFIFRDFANAFKK